MQWLKLNFTTLLWMPKLKFFKNQWTFKEIPNLVFKANFHNQIWRGAQKKKRKNSSKSNSHLQHNICCSIKVFWLYYNSVGNSVAGILDFVAAKGSFIYYVSTYLINPNIFTNFLSIFSSSLCTKNFKLQQENFVKM